MSAWYSGIIAMELVHRCNDAWLVGSISGVTCWAKIHFYTSLIFPSPGIVLRMTWLGGPSQVGKYWASQEGGSGW